MYGAEVLCLCNIAGEPTTINVPYHHVDIFHSCPLYIVYQGMCESLHWCFGIKTLKYAIYMYEFKRTLARVAFLVAASVSGPCAV